MNYPLPLSFSSLFPLIARTHVPSVAPGEKTHDRRGGGPVSLTVGTRGEGRARRRKGSTGVGSEEECSGGRDDLDESQGPSFASGLHSRKGEGEEGMCMWVLVVLL